jgi:hypothetical protein
MNASDKIDAARIDLMLGELRLPGIKLAWSALAATADKEGWPAARFLAALGEQELAERNRRRFERHLDEARLPPGKTLDAFDFAAVPMISKAQVHALAAGDAWIERGPICCASGRPVEANRIWRPRSAWLWSKRAGASCSRKPPTSCNGFRSPVAISASKRRSPGSTNITC